MRNTGTILRRGAGNAAAKTNKLTAKAKPAPLSEDPKQLVKLKLARLSGDNKLASRLANSGTSSVRQIAAAPYEALLKRLDRNAPRVEEETLYATQQYARRVETYAADRAITTALEMGPNGMWRVGVGHKLPDHIPCFCGCCGSIFSLKAYLFDLLDLLAHYWGLGLADVEKLLQRSFSELHLFDPGRSLVVARDLNCEALNKPLPQVRIAVEVLETYLRTLRLTLPTNNANWNNNFVDRLLRLIVPRQVQIAILRGQPRGESLTIAKVQAQTNLPADLAAALTAWKAKLGTLVFNLAGIDEAVGLLSDYSKSFTGFAPGTLLPEDQQAETIEAQRLREVTTRFEERRDATMRQWLADYRNALITASGNQLEILEPGLFISLNSAFCRTTTRMQELITSVQQIVENIRSKEIAATRRRDLNAGLMNKLRHAVSLPLAVTAWERLRDHETWLGYMYGWVYPENVLNPLVFELLDPNAQSSPLGVRARYLNWTHIDDASLNELKRAAKFEALAQWKARVDRKSVRLKLGSSVEFPTNLGSGPTLDVRFGSSLRFLTNLESDLAFPLSAGKVLSQCGFFAEAHDWFSLLYDPVTRSKSPIFEQIGRGTGGAPTGSAVYTGDTGLDDPFDPVAMASRRQNVWLRYTVLAMVRNLIEWADDDFARGLSDTFERAEERYELARRLLDAKDVENECETIILDIRKVIDEALAGNRNETAKYVNQLLEVQSPVALRQAAKQIKTAARKPGSTKQKRIAVGRAVEEAMNLDHQEYPRRSLAADWRSSAAKSTELENAIFFEPDPKAPFPPMPEPKPGPKPKPGGVPEKPLFDLFPPRRPFDELLDPAAPPPPSLAVSLDFCVPLNPALHLLRQQIDTQLFKLSRCLDFVGEPQIPRVYGCDTYDAVTGTINRPTSAVDQYTYSTDQPRYRYSFLVEKARQYVDLAQRIGGLLLLALQNRDNEAFQQLKTEHAVELAGATVELKRLGQIEANDGVRIAKLQSERADSQVDFWDKRGVNDVDDYADALSEDEKASLVFLGQSLEKQQEAARDLNFVATAVGIAAAAGAVMAAVGGAATATGAGAPVGVPLLATGGAVLATATALGPAVASARQAEAGALSQQASLASTRDSLQRRFEDWKNQSNLAKFDAQIADLQERLASDRLAIADQDMVIARLQLSHAREELRFLQTKTTNLPLYDWMVRVLSRDYRSLMQIAAGVARMAQRALEFERQEAVRIIVGDYWNIATGVLGSPGLTDEQRSLGLLGAERLLTDLTKLDAFKLVTEQRRQQQQISKTISLARTMPTDLVAFRQTGKITFNTLMQWFDDDVQGDYLRLIKNVRVTILAIVPPVDGIHAVLYNTGESSVVVTDDGGQTFVKKRPVRSFGERISLDSPFNESGRFVLNYEDPMLLPFEGLGVETQWTLEMPRGNNRFDFDTIADVLLTIDYTAEHSEKYQADLREARSKVDVNEDTAVPLRLQFPDLWYHLKNNRQDTAGSIPSFPYKFHLPRSAFAPNLEDPLNVVHLTLLISGDLGPAEQGLLADGLTISYQGALLHRGVVPRPAPAGPLAGTPGARGDPASAFGPPVFGPSSMLLSTRGNSANGLPFNPAIETVSPGEWTIKFSSALFPVVIDKISDVLFVVTISGRRRQ
jgi:hypothetical protein